MQERPTPHSAFGRRVVGIFGVGKVGSALARLALAAGYEVLVRGSSRQLALDLLVDTIAPGARVVDAAELARRADLVIVAVPFGKVDTVEWELLDDVVVVDTTNYWPPIDGHLADVEADGRSTAEQHADLNPAARVVKSLNHLGYHDMEEDERPAGDPLRRAIAVAGDDADARRVVADFVDAIGFDPVDAGPLASGRLLEPGHLVFGRELDRGELERALAAESARA
ncbi:NADPH-dependent F420 reductase [Agromyces sp. SYSU T00194]|uniref:NADPH-dependent F420 reductase n=1 Tax=Agromyces chitinivorans TaxID=3158560 RepID=UPI0033971B6B